MSRRKKNPLVLTKGFTASICQYQIDAIQKINASQSEVIRNAIDHHLKLKRPPEYIDRAKSR